MQITFFHIAFVVVFLAFATIRIAYQVMARNAMGKAEYIEGKQNSAVRLGLGILLVVVALAYMIWPQLLSWASLPLPEWTRWIGLALCLVSLPLLWWVHHSLGKNFSTTLHIREEHTLVTHGPYRWVRHPMYTVLFLYLLGLLLLTGNWLVGGVPLLGVTIIVAMRLKHEEFVMLEKFGVRYRDYMKRTGRFLPLFGAH